ncbi:MAG: hypothetical protein RLP12_13760 [Ekhidna sp.]
MNGFFDILDSVSVTTGKSQYVDSPIPEFGSKPLPWLADDYRPNTQEIQDYLNSNPALKEWAESRGWNGSSLVTNTPAGPISLKNNLDPVKAVSESKDNDEFLNELTKRIKAIESRSNVESASSPSIVTIGLIAGVVIAGALYFISEDDEKGMNGIIKEVK